MTSKELKEALEGVPDDYEVVVWLNNMMTPLPIETRAAESACVCQNESVFTIFV